MKGFDLQIFADGVSAEGNPAPDTENTGNEEQSPEATPEATADKPQVQSILGDKTDNQDVKEGKEKADEPITYDLSSAVKEMGGELDEKVANGFIELAKDANLSNEQANAIAKYGMQYLQDSVPGILEAVAIDRSEKLYDESIKAYGGTVDNPGEKFNEAVAKAGRALAVLEKDIPDLRQALAESGVDNDVRVLKVFAKIGEMVGEDGNFMSGGSPSKAQSIADVLFGDMKK